MEIEIDKVTIAEIGEDEVELLTRYRMAYLTELQGERAQEYKDRLKKILITISGRLSGKRGVLHLWQRGGMIFLVSER